MQEFLPTSKLDTKHSDLKINAGGPGGIIVTPCGLQATKNEAFPLTHLVR